MDKFSFKKFFSFIFFISYKLLSKCDDICDSFINCVECVFCGDNDLLNCHCLWENDKCYKDDESEDWDTKVKICSLLETDNNIENEYCPSSSSKKNENDLDDDNSITFTIKPDSDGFYGQNKNICEFKYEQSIAKDIIIDVEFSNYIEKYPDINIENTNYNSLVSKIYVETNRKIELAKSVKVTIKILLKEKYTTSPIKIKLSIKHDTLSNVISIIVTILFIGIILVCLVYCCYKRYKINEERRQLRIFLYNQARQNMAQIEQENNNYIQITNVDIEKINKEKLDKLFNNQMAQHLYKKEYNEYGGGCSICLEEFNKKSKVSITSCKHVFHYKCIYDWLYKNIKNPKCPNCNHEILKDVDENSESNKIKSTKVIKVKRKTGQNNYRANNLNQNLNFDRGTANTNNAINIVNIESSHS